MPEGDTVFQAARRLREAIGGETVTGFDLRVPHYATVDLTGSVVHDVIPRGKHLLHHIGSETVHTHLKMEGVWHVYRPGEHWHRPAWKARAIISTREWITVGFDLGIVEVFPTAEDSEHFGWLGPDLLGPDWNEEEAIARLAADPREIHVALLDQRNLAGLGNEYVNELCFLRGMLPTRPTSEVDLPATVHLAHRLIIANRDRRNRVTTGDTRPGRTSWVFSRDGQRCLRCGTRIKRGKLGADPTALRDTYWCPSCQR
ncbi:DNA-formamidopyrimidine glycosylase family protein [Plantibacter sp. YIM 135347]|jgi:endonuclease-8|uniref:DNA-formamidopyrimidine glycosylase family protein n=1 Tax=Plantibacter sp. YIM 135347 TaxID=3423919 RepID=UPI003D346D6F